MIALLCLVSDHTLERLDVNNDSPHAFRFAADLSPSTSPFYNVSFYKKKKNYIMPLTMS